MLCPWNVSADDHILNENDFFLYANEWCRVLQVEQDFLFSAGDEGFCLEAPESASSPCRRGRQCTGAPEPAADPSAALSAGACRDRRPLCSAQAAQIPAFWNELWAWSRIAPVLINKQQQRCAPARPQAHRIFPLIPACSAAPARPTGGRGAPAACPPAWLPVGRHGLARPAGSRTAITISPSPCAHNTRGVPGAERCPGRGCCLATGDPARRGGRRCARSLRGARGDSLGNGLRFLLPLNLRGYGSQVPSEETVSKKRERLKNKI